MNTKNETSAAEVAGPLVSIVVITYNQAEYIDEAVLSCMHQTYPNIEIIVSDDASTDSTATRVEQLRQRDPRIRLFVAEKNRGITGNAQHALEQCQGKYVAFLGGDDFLYPEKISVQLACMEQDENLALSFTQCHVIYGIDPTPVRTTGSTKISDVSDGYELAGNFGVEIPGPAPMVRRSMIPVGGFRSLAPIASDWLFFIETAHTRKCKLIKTPLAAYRMHERNIGKNRYAYVNDYISSYEFIANTYRNDAHFVHLSRVALKRYMLGTFYASIIDNKPEASLKVASSYREVFGRSFVFILMMLVRRAKLSMLFSFLKPLLKKIV